MEKVIIFLIALAFLIGPPVYWLVQEKWEYEWSGKCKPATAQDKLLSGYTLKIKSYSFNDGSHRGMYLCKN
jgi:hypothetical protein